MHPARRRLVHRQGAATPISIWIPICDDMHARGLPAVRHGVNIAKPLAAARFPRPFASTFLGRHTTETGERSVPACGWVRAHKCAADCRRTDCRRRIAAVGISEGDGTEGETAQHSRRSSALLSNVFRAPAAVCGSKGSSGAQAGVCAQATPPPSWRVCSHARPGCFGGSFEARRGRDQIRRCLPNAQPVWSGDLWLLPARLNCPPPCCARLPLPGAGRPLTLPLASPFSPRGPATVEQVLRQCDRRHYVDAGMPAPYVYQASNWLSQFKGCNCCPQLSQQQLLTLACSACGSLNPAHLSSQAAGGRPWIRGPRGAGELAADVVG